MKTTYLLNVFSKNSKLILLIAIPIISIIMHFRVFSLDLMSIHVWRQTQTQSTIINFYEEDFNILNPRRNDRGEGEGIFRMEFPIMQWIFASFYRLFGNNVIISRILSFFISLVSIYGIYALLKNLFKNINISLIGAWAFTFSPTFFYYAVNPIPDNLALCCSIWGIAFFFKWLNEKTTASIVFSGLLLSFGILSKLPFVLYYSVPFIYFLLKILKSEFRKFEFINLIIISLFLIPPALWYLWVIPGWYSNNIVEGITAVTQSRAELFEIMTHHLISTLPEMLINYGSLLFFFAGFFFLFKNKLHRKKLFPVFLIWGIAIILYFLFEMNMIEKTHDYYLFPFLPLIFIIVSYGAVNLIQKRSKFLLYFSIFLLCVLPVTTHLRMKVRWNPESPGFNKDLLIYKNELRSLVPKDDLCVVGDDISHFIFHYYVDKKGWSFDHGNLNPESLEDKINKGAKYIYCDNRNIDENEKIRQYFDKLIFNKGSIKVYSLKSKIKKLSPAP